MSTLTAPVPFALQTSKRIRALLPDDGTDRQLVRALREDKGINAVDSVAVRAVSMLQEAKSSKGQLPEPMLARLVTVIVSPENADEIFEFIFQVANINRPGGGLMLMDRLVGTTAFCLPDGIPDEQQ